MDSDRSRDRVQSVERAFAVLGVFNQRATDLSTAEIASRSGLSRPVVRRLLLTMEHLGYVGRSHGNWSLTPQILELGAAYYSETSLPQIAQRPMEEVVETLGETCSLGVLSGTDIMHIARVHDRRPFTESIRVGNRLPAHATAIGKALLAQLSEADFAEYLAHVDLEQHTAATLTTPSVLRARIELARENSYDVSIEELRPGTVAAAVPIVAGASVIGALGISSTTARQSEATLIATAIPVLRTAVERIARGYHGAHPDAQRGANANEYH